jgi:hypothetical protein
LDEQEGGHHADDRCESKCGEGDLQGAAQGVQEAGPVFNQAAGDVGWGGEQIDRNFELPAAELPDPDKQNTDYQRRDHWDEPFAFG